MCAGARLCIDSASLISPLVCQNDLDESDLSASIDLIASEERVNVDRRWWGTSVVKVRILLAGLVLLGTGCAVLGWGTRFGKTVRNRASDPGTSAVGLEPGGELKARAHSIVSGLPLIFEPNLGQANLD